MLRALAGLVIPLLCIGCAAAAPETASLAANQRSAVTMPQCSDYTATAIVNGLQQPVSGHLCRRPDGALVVMESIAGEPTVTTVYWPAYAGPMIASWPWAPSFGFGAGAIFIDGHNHFHRFRHFTHRHHFERFHAFGHHHESMAGRTGHGFGGHGRD